MYLSISVCSSWYVRQWCCLQRISKRAKPFISAINKQDILWRPIYGCLLLWNFNDQLVHREPQRKQFIRVFFVVLLISAFFPSRYVKFLTRPYSSLHRIFFNSYHQVFVWCINFLISSHCIAYHFHFHNRGLNIAAYALSTNCNCLGRKIGCGLIFYQTKKLWRRDLDWSS